MIPRSDKEARMAQHAHNGRCGTTFARRLPGARRRDFEPDGVNPWVWVVVWCVFIVGVSLYVGVP